MRIGRNFVAEDPHEFFVGPRPPVDRDMLEDVEPVLADQLPERDDSLRGRGGRLGALRGRRVQVGVNQKLLGREIHRQQPLIVARVRRRASRGEIHLHMIPAPSAT